jgi:hypothetical protein
MHRIISISFIAFLLVFVNINPVASDALNESVQPIDLTIDPPNNTQIDIKLSEYYGIPVANGPNGTFWYVEQSWYSSEEIVNLSTNTQMYGVPPSVYDVFSNSKVPMPISFLFIVVFIGIAYYISKRIL